MTSGRPQIRHWNANELSRTPHRLAGRGPAGQGDRNLLADSPGAGASGPEEDRDLDSSGCPAWLGLPRTDPGAAFYSSSTSLSGGTLATGAYARTGYRSSCTGPNHAPAARGMPPPLPCYQRRGALLRNGPLRTRDPRSGDRSADSPLPRQELEIRSCEELVTEREPAGLRVTAAAPPLRMDQADGANDSLGSMSLKTITAGACTRRLTLASGLSVREEAGNDNVAHKGIALRPTHVQARGESGRHRLDGGLSDPNQTVALELTEVPTNAGRCRKTIPRDVTTCLLIRSIALAAIVKPRASRSPRSRAAAKIQTCVDAPVHERRGCDIRGGRQRRLASPSGKFV